MFPISAQGLIKVIFSVNLSTILLVTGIVDSRRNSNLDIVAYAFNPTTWDAEARSSWVWGQTGWEQDLVSKEKNKEKVDEEEE